MFFKSKEFAHYVTRLDNSWPLCNSVEFAVLHTERMTAGHIGNKAFKLASVLAGVDPPERLLSFGGAWSNHLHAMAYLCHQHGIGSVGVVRDGGCAGNVLQHSMRRYGMHLHFVDRAEYRKRDDVDYCESLRVRFGCCRWLPEGGADLQAVHGCADIGDAIRLSGYHPDVVIVPVGTGATLAGVINGTEKSIRVVGLPVVRDDKVAVKILNWVGGQRNRWELHAPLTPGYGKSNEPLLRFIVEFHAQFGVILDPVYTGKALMHSLGPEFSRVLPVGSRVLFVHTGGLMGNYGFVDDIRALATLASDQFLAALNDACREHLANP